MRVTHMLQAEHVAPEQLGYDRPSTKFLSFLSKHFNLSHYRTQAWLAALLCRTDSAQTNNFVVFREYFGGPSRAGSAVPRGPVAKAQELQLVQGASLAPVAVATPPPARRAYMLPPSGYTGTGLAPQRGAPAACPGHWADSGAEPLKFRASSATPAYPRPNPAQAQQPGARHVTMLRA